MIRLDHADSVVQEVLGVKCSALCVLLLGLPLRGSRRIA